MSTDLVKDKAREAFSNALSVGNKYAAELAESEEFFKPIVMAMAIQDIRGALTPEAMAAVQALEGSALGFKTDLIDRKYPPEVIRDCVIEAMLRGVSVAGNQFNIIKGNFYIAKNGWEARLRKAGCTEIVPTPGRPEDVQLGTPNEKGNRQISAVFGAQATCMKDGKRYTVTAAKTQEVDGRIDVAAFGKDLSAVIDGMKGKVTARILQKLFCLACDASEEDGDESNVIVIEQPAVAVTDDSQKTVDESPEDDARKVQKAGFDGWLKAAQTRVTDAAQLATINEYWSEIANATNKDQLRLLHQDLTKNQVKPLGKNNVDELCRWCAWNAEVLP